MSSYIIETITWANEGMKRHNSINEISLPFRWLERAMIQRRTRLSNRFKPKIWFCFFGKVEGRYI